MKRARQLGWIAAALTFTWFLVHTFVGGAEVAGPLRASDLPMSVMAPAWMVWHMVTGLLLFLALLFAWAAVKGARDAMVVAAAISAVLAIAGLAAAPLTGAGFLALPQGFLFVPGALLGWIAARGMGQRS